MAPVCSVRYIYVPWPKVYTDSVNFIISAQKEWSNKFDSKRVIKDNNILKQCVVVISVKHYVYVRARGKKGGWNILEILQRAQEFSNLRLISGS